MIVWNPTCLEVISKPKIILTLKPQVQVTFFLLSDFFWHLKVFFYRVLKNYTKSYSHFVCIQIRDHTYNTIYALYKVKNNENKQQKQQITINFAFTLKRKRIILFALGFLPPHGKGVDLEAYDNRSNQHLK